MEAAVIDLKVQSSAFARRDLRKKLKIAVRVTCSPS